MSVVIDGLEELPHLGLGQVELVSATSWPLRFRVDREGPHDPQGKADRKAAGHVYVLDASLKKEDGLSSLATYSLVI